MAAPSPTTRQTPTGIKLDDGFSTKVTFGSDPDLSVWEKEVTPPGKEGGDPIDTTTMWNDTYETVRPRALIKSTNGQILVAYDPAVVDDIEAMVNVETTITFTYPDGTTEAIFGFLKSFQRQAMQRNAQPQATIEIVETDWDYSNKVEAGQAIASVAGT